MSVSSNLFVASVPSCWPTHTTYLPLPLTPLYPHLLHPNVSYSSLKSNPSYPLSNTNLPSFCCFHLEYSQALLLNVVVQMLTGDYPGLVSSATGAIMQEIMMWLTHWYHLTTSLISWSWNEEMYNHQGTRTIWSLSSHPYTHFWKSMTMLLFTFPHDLSTIS